MFAYKFSMNTVGEISRCILRYRWVNRSKRPPTKLNAVLGHIEAGDRFDDFRTRAVGASVASFIRVHPTCTCFGIEKPTARRPRNLPENWHRLCLIHFKMLNHRLLSFLFFSFVIVSFRYTLFFYIAREFFWTWERAFSTSYYLYIDNSIIFL